MAEEYLKTHSFIKAIKYLAKNNNDFDIVFRPHPVENIESWKFYLDGIPNVYVIRESAINSGLTIPLQLCIVVALSNRGDTCWKTCSELCSISNEL